MTEDEIRADERAHIARCVRATANDTIRNPKSDGVDGFVGAVLLEIADRIEAGS